MLVIPAIDLKGGQVVRLSQGDPLRQTAYSADPVAMARRWEDEGAPILHLVDLDGAFAGKPQQLAVVAQVARSIKIPVQLGGGLRTLAALEQAFASGIERAVLGTAAIEDEGLLREAAETYPGRILLGIDAKNGKVAVRGWAEATTLLAADLAIRAADLPLAAIIYTDIERDGMLTGPNLDALRRMAQVARHPIIASGGIAALDDLRRLATLEPSIVPRVYAPYVLLRSWQQWQDREVITLPGDIRAILEATYAAPVDDEPRAWRELHEELKRKSAALGAKALNAANVWFQPSLPDDEGVQTRYSNYTTTSLLVARDIEAVDTVSVRLTLLNGDIVTVSGREWNIEAARALYRNLVRMPRWAVRTGLEAAPAWLRLHVAQPTVIGLLQSSGAVEFWQKDVESGLSYCPERGIVIAPGKRPATTAQENWDEDESCD